MTVKRVGRPHSPEISEALIVAAGRIMTAEGYSQLSVDRLVTEVGTTRPSFYRRYPSVAHLAFEAIKNGFGPGRVVDTGSLLEDLVQLQMEDIEMFSSPLIRKNLPGLLESLQTHPDVAELYRQFFIGPRRANVARVVAAAVSRREVPQGPVDLDLVCDLLLGPILVRVLLPVTGPLDSQLAHQTALAAFRAASPPPPT